MKSGVFTRYMCHIWCVYGMYSTRRETDLCQNERRIKN